MISALYALSAANGSLSVFAQNDSQQTTATIVFNVDGSKLETEVTLESDEEREISVAHNMSGTRSVKAYVKNDGEVADGPLLLNLDA